MNRTARPATTDPTERRLRRTPSAAIRARVALLLATCTTATLLTVTGGADPAGAVPPVPAKAPAMVGSVPSGATKASITAKVGTAASEQARPEVATGRAAIEELGHDIQENATKGNLTVAQLEKAFVADRSLQVNEEGTVQVADALGGTGATVTTGSSTALLWPVANTLTLHSRPSSPRKIYLDFNGHTTSGTVWNTRYSSFTTPVWGRDTNGSSFSAVEAAAIQHAFASVTEDFAPFDVDVTTQDPGIEGLRRTSAADTAYGIRVVVGPDTWLGVPNSGYAQLNSFTWNTDTPAYCFAGAGTPTKQIAECISHEAGHTVGLLHDGTAATTYYGGHGNWAPIMGNSYGRPVTQWSSGQYAGANNYQNDLAVVASYLGWAPDDVTGTTATTATLPAGTTRSGQISYGTGEYDAFRFTLTASRRVNIQSWEWFQAVDNNLNMRTQLTNANGTVLYASSPAGNTRTNMTVTLGPGTYYVFLDGVGEYTAATGYTNYASMGFYNVLLQFV